MAIQGYILLNFKQYVEDITETETKISELENVETVEIFETGKYDAVVRFKTPNYDKKEELVAGMKKIKGIEEGSIHVEYVKRRVQKTELGYKVEDNL